MMSRPDIPEISEEDQEYIRTVREKYTRYWEALKALTTTERLDEIFNYCKRCPYHHEADSQVFFPCNFNIEKRVPDCLVYILCEIEGDLP